LKPWTIIGRGLAPGGAELTLIHHVSEYVIQADGQTLMSSRLHGSEEMLATLGCVDARTLDRPRVLVGGLGMGFTLRAALDCLPPRALVDVAELVPVVAEWNRGPLASLANHPLDDGRVQLHVGDVMDVMHPNPRAFDAILLDVDNGPAAQTAHTNDRIYSEAGIAIARRSLKPRGVLAVWSVRDERSFERRLKAGGFNVDREHVNSRHAKRGSQHTILVARVGSPESSGDV
jgi:spermidine synthase